MPERLALGAVGGLLGGLSLLTDRRPLEAHLLPAVSQQGAEPQVTSTSG